MRHNCSVLFHLKLQTRCLKGAHQSASFQTSTACMIINQIPLLFFKPRVSFPSTFTLPFSVMTHNFSEIFLLKHIICSGQQEPSRVQSCRHLSALMKVHPFFCNLKIRIYSNFALLSSVVKGNSSVFF